jgi:hypothetical protein
MFPALIITFVYTFNIVKNSCIPKIISAKFQFLGTYG